MFPGFAAVNNWSSAGLTARMEARSSMIRFMTVLGETSGFFIISRAPVLTATSSSPTSVEEWVKVLAI
ncbi:hypothetical protein D3C73_1312390 [compost metagenome]